MTSFRESLNGTYVAIKPAIQSAEKLREILVELNIPNLISQDEYHTTIAYSKKYFNPGFVKKSIDVEAKVSGFTFFPNSAEPGKFALVLKLDCPEALDFHNKTMEQGASFDIEELKGIKITFNTIYSQPLDLDWNKK